jgi:sulfite reductase beta subunit-like hemoprotein
MTRAAEFGEPVTNRVGYGTVSQKQVEQFNWPRNATIGSIFANVVVVTTAAAAVAV